MKNQQLQRYQSANGLSVNLMASLLLVGPIACAGVIGANLMVSKPGAQTDLQQPIGIMPAVYRISMPHWGKDAVGEQYRAKARGAVVEVGRSVTRQLEHCHRSDQSVDAKALGHESVCTGWIGPNHRPAEATNPLWDVSDIHPEFFGNGQITQVLPVDYPIIRRCMNAGEERTICPHDNSGRETWIRLSWPPINASLSLRI